MVIAKRKNAVFPLYIFTAIVGVAAIVMSFMTDIKFMIMGVLVEIVSIYILVGFCKVPPIIITLDENGILHLPGNVTVVPSEISDVSYKPARAKHVQYKWGNVEIVTYSGTYKLKYVAECEAVAKKLTELKYTYASTPSFTE